MIYIKSFKILKNSYIYYVTIISTQIVFPDYAKYTHYTELMACTNASTLDSYKHGYYKIFLLQNDKYSTLISM